MEDVAFFDATAQADLVRRKQVKPIELVDAAIERIERLNPALNAVVTPMYDIARGAASSPLPDGPFTGVPFLLKDLSASYAGVRLTSGSAFLKDYVPHYDSELVARYKPARHGGDGGGSIRLPASCCGIVGRKPTRGRNPMGPDLGDAMNGLVVSHVLTRSVRDCAALLDATSGPDIGDPYWAPPPERPFLQEVGANPGRLRIAFTTQAPTGTPIHPDCVADGKEAAALCEELGHEVVEASPPVNGPMLIQMFTIVWAAGGGRSVGGVARVTP